MDAEPPPADAIPPQDPCDCIEQYGESPQPPTRFHSERQDTAAPGWLRLLELIDEAAADGREVFKPLAGLTPGERRDVITLPAQIARLAEVKRLDLYGSNIVRLPPEIGKMRSLAEFVPYTSGRLHWFPYELARLPDLRAGTVSTRSVYGNHKYRPHFPPLAEARAEDLGDLDPGVWGATAIRACGVCDGPVDAGGLRQRWISLRVFGADVLPLLVNACSDPCVAALPAPPDGYIPVPHTGGRHLAQPEGY